MGYDFDRVIDRRNTGSLKYDGARSRGKSPDLLPLWVADMDFPAPQPVLDALQERVHHGVFGYSEPDESYYEAVRSWFATRLGVAVDRSWFVLAPGVVFALAAAVRAFTQPGDAVLVQPPVYYPFFSVVKDNGRTVVEAPLSYHVETASYDIDFGQFERAAARQDVKLFLLCNPHNPVGRAWTHDELWRLGDICRKHDVLVVSDEIHADFARGGHEHASFLSLGDGYAQRCIACTAPSKTFNLAGLQVANVFVADPEARAKFRHAVAQTGYSQLNALGLVAAQASYEHGAPWLDELKVYLDGNYLFLKECLAKEAPELKVIDLQSTYLVWVDCRALGLDDRQLRRLVEDEAGLWLDMGTMFGSGGSGFVRINIACPRATLQDACTRLAGAVEGLRKGKCAPQEA